VATQSLKAAIPAPIRDGVAIVLDALHIRKRFVDGPMGFDPATGLSVDVAVYFPDNMSKAYQLIQWLPVLEDHPSDLTFGIVVRKIPIYLELKELTKLPVAYVPTFADVMELYRISPFKAVMYVNNGVGNFQSLTVAELAHIHVNHGESDKICMVSNQVKAYDRVFVAGQAAVLRHRAALSEFNEEVLVRVGRPQLDENPAPSIPESTRRTVLYAPTWAGEDEANNYTSMEDLATYIIDAILAQENIRVVYKPHPRIADSDDGQIRKNHAYVLRAIKQANVKDPSAGHHVRETGDILAIFPRVDLLISDVSSIALDFLYLRTQAPIVLTDRRDDLSQLHIDSPLSVATPVLSRSNIVDAKKTIGEILSSDTYVQDRKVLREFYFDNVKAGESAPRFFEAMRQAIKDHSADMDRARSLAESGTGPRFEHRS
jgi:hypothetical protein